MFVEAIETVTQFTRPIHSIARNYDSNLIQPGTATLFFVNSDGWALTCRHVAESLLVADQIGQKRLAFTQELEATQNGKNIKKYRRKLAQKYGYTQQTTFELYNKFVNCVEGELNIEVRLHDHFDMALLRFLGFNSLLCTSFPLFAVVGGDLKAGKFLCRLGYPFPEFNNFACDPDTNSIKWTDKGQQSTPWFPIEGMVTRRLADDDQVIGFEMSTPGLRGQSGGPVFDSEGRVWGMQVATAHLDLDFDVNQEVIRNGNKSRARDNAFLHVGRCVHVDILKAFMTEHGVRFQQG